jgi:Cytidylate kinase-like family
VVCISFEDGAGGQQTAELVAKALDFRLIDEEIVERAALEAGVEEMVVADVERRKSALVRLIEGIGTSGAGAGYVLAAPYTPSREPASDELRGLIRSAIEDTAEKGRAVIVSHAASFALGGREDVLRALVTASPETRARRLADALGGDEGEAAKVLKRGDQGRADYIKRFYGVGRELPRHYDIVVSTDKLPFEDAAALIVQAAGGVTSR